MHWRIPWTRLWSISRLAQEFILYSNIDFWRFRRKLLWQDLVNKLFAHSKQSGFLNLMYSLWQIAKSWLSRAHYLLFWCRWAITMIGSSQANYLFFAAALGRDYRFVYINEKLEQPAASARCNALGGQLASILSQEENDAAAYLTHPAWCPQGWGRPLGVVFFKQFESVYAYYVYILVNSYIPRNTVME